MSPPPPIFLDKPALEVGYDKEILVCGTKLNGGRGAGTARM
jgi:hypothetical protein